jgi:hypothetical protein
VVVWRPLRTRLRIKLRGLYHWSYYPTSIKKYLFAFQHKNDFDTKTIQYWNFFKTNINSGKQVDFNINCAGRDLMATELLNFWSPMAEDLDDIEVLQSTHRFHWAVEKVAKGLSEANIKLIVEIISNWIKQFSKPDVSQAAWQPYTVSERLCNWITFLQATQVLANYPEYRESFLLAIKNNIIYLTETLEYPASGIINNHILNNARALYISGKFFENEYVAAIGREIIIENFPRMTGKNGFLLEASSHYHFLLTRTALEVNKIAQETNDIDFSNWIEKQAQKMLKACQKILPQNIHGLDQMPRIGDISPDIPFSWFSPISDQLNGDWNKLWSVATLSTRKNSNKFESDGWITIENKNWSIIAFSHPDRTQYPIGHGHDDFGSFCLYFDGWEILNDKGCLNYIPIEKGGSLGRESKDHSGLLIDSENALFVGTGIKSLLSSVSIGQTNYILGENNDSIIWNIPCINGAKWLRMLKVDSDSSVLIVDKVDSCKLVKGFLNLPADANPKKVSDFHIEFLMNDYLCQIKQLNMHNLKIEDTDFYPQYGVKIKSKRICWSATVEKGHLESIIQISIKKMIVK